MRSRKSDNGGRPDQTIAPKLTERGGVQRVTVRERDAMIIMKAQGATVDAIAAALNRGRDTVARVVRSAAKAVETEAPDFRVEMKTKAVIAVNAGLDSDEDAYKRGNLGVQVLKGIGVFAPDGAAVTINNLVGAVPEQWKERYIVNDGNSMLEGGTGDDATELREE